MRERELNDRQYGLKYGILVLLICYFALAVGLWIGSTCTAALTAQGCATEGKWSYTSKVFKPETITISCRLESRRLENHANN